MKDIKEKIKRFVSCVIAMVLVLSLPANVLAYENPKKDCTYYEVLGEKFEVVFSRQGNVATAKIYENEGKIVNILELNEETGDITYNGKIIEMDLILTDGVTARASSNWGSPSTTIESLSLVSLGISTAVTLLQMKFGMGASKASSIAQIVISGSGILYVKSVTRLNYVDYAPKVGFKLTESLHLKPNASDPALYTRTTTGSR